MNQKHGSIQAEELRMSHSGKKNLAERLKFG